jgi:hypothetical protein
MLEGLDSWRDLGERAVKGSPPDDRCRNGGREPADAVSESRGQTRPPSSVFREAETAARRSQ